MRDHLATLIDDFRQAPNEIAVVRYQGVRRRVATYGQIAQLAGRFAAFLASKNIAAGDRILIWAENSAEWIAAFHGCILRGVLAVPLDAYGSASFAARVAADVQPKLAVGDALLLRQLPASIPQITFENGLSELPSAEIGPVSGLSRETPLEILFTSGTTGDPKGVVITHGNVLSSIGPIEDGARPYMRYERIVHPIRILHTLPLSHVFGQTMGLWIPPILRGEVHFESRLVAPRLIETIHRERISVLAAVPRIFALLKTHLEATIPDLSARLEAAQKKPAGKLGWKRWVAFRDVHRAFGLKFWALISGGGALAPQVEQFWNALAFVLVQGYGMTETTALITLNHPFHVARGTIGKPLPGREVKITPEGEVLVRGPMISTATWSGGQLHEREEEWLSTGDLAEAQSTGELRFLGRKSEVIVTSSGVNIHPEDLEAVLEDQPGVAACAVVAADTPNGPEPCAVFAMRDQTQIAGAVERANARLPEFQRLRRWVLYPEPDLPRTSTGKVRRKAVSEWLAGIEAAARGQRSTEAFSPARDWLLALIAQITGEPPHGIGDELRLSEDLHLDSLGRVQLAAAIEQKLGMAPESGFIADTETLGELRSLITGERRRSTTEGEPQTGATEGEPQRAATEGEPRRGITLVVPIQPNKEENGALAPERPAPYNQPTMHDATQTRTTNIYPRWPWLTPFQWLRSSFIELIMRPLVWLLAAPHVVAPANLDPSEPILIVANHITTYDGPLIQYALPGRVRRHIAAAMSGEMLDDYLHFRNPDRKPGTRGFDPFGPLEWFLITLLFNVFPLPRRRDFQQSFAHAGLALDRGYNVLVFPEGTRSAAGQLARFRSGIGLLVRQSGTAVLPVALRGLGELKARGRGWFRSGSLEVRVGTLIRFAPEASESEITARLQSEVARLLG